MGSSASPRPFIPSSIDAGFVCFQARLDHADIRSQLPLGI
jgi:hypothetical protein